jgi:predicted kinase
MYRKNIKVSNIKEGVYNRGRLPEFLMTVGISGSGKSSYLIKHVVDMLIVSPDNLRRSMFGDVSNNKNNAAVWNKTIGMVEGVLLVKKDVALDATNVEADKWVGMVESLPECYKIAWVFDVYPSVACDRLMRDKFAGKDRSDVPKEVVYKQYEEFKDTVPKLSKYFDKVVFFDTMVQNNLLFA